MADIDIDPNSGLSDEENMYSNDIDNGTVNTETGKIKNSNHNNKKVSDDKSEE